MTASPTTLVVALGGNAISSSSNASIHEEFANTRESIRNLRPLLDAGVRLIITHGNGPQVGNRLLSTELSWGKVPSIPLGVLVADTQGSIGYMIEQCLRNDLIRRGQGTRTVATVVTQVLVDRHDPALIEPTKFVGQAYTVEQAMALREERQWVLREDKGRGWRRVVGSPRPLEVVNAPEIRTLLDSGAVVIAGGGGGIPCYREDDGTLEGVDAVIDKDRLSALLANQVQAPELYILTGVSRVAIHFGTPDVKYFDTLTVAEARELAAAGHFPAGSMGPKVEAAIQFIEGGGSRCLITDFAGLGEALAGGGGTWIVA
jgi:carbamate kinase